MGDTIRSTTGLFKITCECRLSICNRAHPNDFGSKVRHPKWCLIGSRANCTNVGCPFNHFQTIEQFVNYRINDPIWKANNAVLIASVNYTDDTEYEDDISEYTPRSQRYIKLGAFIPRDLL
jgi:hypothetical protein